MDPQMNTLKLIKTRMLTRYPSTKRNTDEKMHIFRFFGWFYGAIFVNILISHVIPSENTIENFYLLEYLNKSLSNFIQMGIIFDTILKF